MVISSRFRRFSFALLVTALCFQEAMISVAAAARPDSHLHQEDLGRTHEIESHAGDGSRGSQIPPRSGWTLADLVSRSEDIRRIARQLRQELARAADFAKIELRVLPDDPSKLDEQGLLVSAASPYVVPGGRFNEMYGWDSFFIQIGLLHDGEMDLAKDMADNFLYEIREYGKILNANRTYYLTRSQPPFLTEMLLGVYEKTKDRKWLEDVRCRQSRNITGFGQPSRISRPPADLSRYYDLGEGPAPEVLSSEKDAQGRTSLRADQGVLPNSQGHRLRRRRILRSLSGTFSPSLFYKGDRSMRESGFDPSDRFGKFNVDIIHYNPVCLNSLLYLMESQTAEILRILDRPVGRRHLG